jgi:hypothetical protein
MKYGKFSKISYPQPLILVSFFTWHFLLISLFTNLILYMLFWVKNMKTSKNVSMCHRLWEFYHIYKILEMLLFVLLVAIYVPQFPSLLIRPLTAENGATRRFALRFCSQTCQTNFLAYSRSSWPGCSNHIGFSYLRLPELGNGNLKMLKQFMRSSLSQKLAETSRIGFGFKQQLLSSR